jgi:hypothetical protein
MEEYSKVVCLCFIPFRNPSRDLKVDGSFHKKFQMFFFCVGMNEQHVRILQNIQDCHNSLKAGRPEDKLERCTKGPDNVEGRFVEERETLEEAFLELVDNSITYESFGCPSFRDHQNRFQAATEYLRSFGTFSCGFKNFVSGDSSKLQNASIFLEQDVASVSNMEVQQTDMTHNVDAKVLLELSMKKTVRNVGSSRTQIVVPALGTLLNIREYADSLF